MSFSFGTPTTTAATAAPAFGAATTGFGGASAIGSPAFGAATGTTPAFGAAPGTTPAFGAAPGTTPAFGAATGTTPGFGAAPGTTAFGAAAGKTPAFGAPVGSVAGAAPAFGATTGAMQGFGAPPAAVPVFGAATPAFGSTTTNFACAVTTAPPAFGSQPTAATAAPTLGFGTGTGLGGLAAAAVTSTANTPSFNFATPAAAPLFGAATSTPAPATATVAPTLNFSAGGGIGSTAPTAATAAPSFSFGGATAATTAAPTLGLGGGIGSFSFGKPTGAAPAATTVASLNFGTTTTTATAAPFRGSIFGKPLTGATSTSLTAPTASVTATPFVGLGGIDVSATQPKPGDAKLDTIKVKETQVPDEIAKTVNVLKQYIREQKTISSDIGRISTSKFTTVSSAIANLEWSLQEIANSVEQNYQHIKQLRAETSKAIQAVEMAQRTQDTPTGLQFENNAPFQYFQCLVARYERDLIAFRQQIMMTERHMQALANPQNISPEELKRGFKQINEAFISIAGRLQEIHQKVEEQKDQYLNLRRYRLRDPTNVFEKLDKSPSAQAKAEPLRISAGPTPFSNISGMNTLGKSFNATTANGSNTSAAAAK